MTRTFTTSGTSGPPKLFAVSDELLAARAAARTSSRAEVFAGVRSLASDLLESTTSTVANAAWAAANGVRFFPLAQLSLAESLTLFRAHNVDALTSTPYGLMKFAAGKGAHRFKAILATGEPLTLASLRSIQAGLGANVATVYGASEVGSIAIATGEQLEALPGCAGALCPGVEVEFDGDLLKIKTSAMISGYLDPELTAKFFIDGWFVPGDTGYMQDGLLVLTGRRAQPRLPARPPPQVMSQAAPAGVTKVTVPTIAVVNLTTVVNDAHVSPVLAAIRLQVIRDFGPLWELGANFIQVFKGQQPPPGSYVMLLMDNSDQPNALGYHDITPDGMPVGRVFVKTDLQYGLSWSVTLSHEVLEMLVDPYCSSTVFAQTSDTTGILMPYEVCDAVEDDSLGYQINGTLVSDFVTPAWFEDFRAPNSTRFSFGNHVHAPFQLAHGGYISQFIVGPHMTGWTQKFAQGTPGQRAINKAPKSRTMRRFHRRQTP